MAYELAGAIIETDDEGYISDSTLWSPDLAVLIAENESIEMGADHWEVIDYLRHFYQEYEIDPAVRVLTKAIKRTLGPEKGNSRYLYQLFPFGPVKQGSKIAGLPKPTSCI